ncbi:MAG: glycosyltransferase family 2 protein [Candidatus Micrarchaeota archaeon]|nr:glycosyltransferase family 2 protein [Candidatus Micrarchaeota archaeon]
MYNKMKMNIIMPVFNEERTLGEIIRRVLAQPFVDRLIIIDDCSKDRSLEIIKAAAKRERRITYMRNSENMGKGHSVRRGIAAVRSGIILIQDADLEYYPEDYAKLLKLLHGDVVVYGTRMIGKQTGHNYTMAKFANASLTWLFNILYKQRITDMNTCYKIFTKGMLSGIKLKEEGFLIEPEISIKLAKKGYRIIEARIRYKGRTYAEGKKITAKDGIKQALYMVRESLA